MTMQVRPLNATFGAEIENLDLNDLSDDEFSALYEAWLEYSFLLFRGQNLTTDQQIEFAKRFGKLEFDLFELSNVKEDGSLREGDDDDMVKILKGNMGWHHDSTYMPVQAKGAVFSAHVVPSSGGETGWADMSAAYDALDDSLKDRIAGLSAHHSLVYSQQKVGFKQKEKDSEYMGYGFDQSDAKLRPLVKTHSETGRKTLTIGRHAHAIPGLDEAESEKLLDELVDFACQRPRIYQHKWSPGDVVVWDNRNLMHQACPWDMREKRVMFHTRIAGDPEHEGVEQAR